MPTNPNTLSPDALKSEYGQPFWSWLSSQSGAPTLPTGDVNVSQGMSFYKSLDPFLKQYKSVNPDFFKPVGSPSSSGGLVGQPQFSPGTPQGWVNTPNGTWWNGPGAAPSGTGPGGDLMVNPLGTTPATTPTTPPTTLPTTTPTDPFTSWLSQQNVFPYTQSTLGMSGWNPASGYNPAASGYNPSAMPNYTMDTYP